jgi:hypothetical protein
MNLLLISIFVGVIGACLTLYRIYLFKKSKPTYEDEIKANSIKLENCRRLLCSSEQNLINIQGALNNSEEDIKIIQARAAMTSDDDVLKALFQKLTSLKEIHASKLASYITAKERHDSSIEEFKNFEITISNLKTQVQQTQNAEAICAARQIAQGFASDQKSILSDLVVKENTADEVAKFLAPQLNEFQVAADQEDFRKWKSELK